MGSKGINIKCWKCNVVISMCLNHIICTEIKNCVPVVIWDPLDNLISNIMSGQGE